MNDFDNGFLACERLFCEALVLTGDPMIIAKVTADFIKLKNIEAQIIEGKV